MTVRRGIAALLAVTMLLPSAAASLDIVASSISSPDAATASLARAVVDWQTQDHPAGALEFTLRAEAIVVETDAGDFVQAGVTAVGARPPTTEQAGYSSAMMEGRNWYNDTSVFVVPHDAVGSATLLGFDAKAPSEPCRPQPIYIDGARTAVCADLAQAVSLAGKATGMSVEGSFDVYLWGWRGAISSPEGDTEYWTGIEYSTPQLPDVSTGPSERRFVKAEVTNGTLDLGLDGTQVSLFPQEASIVSADVVVTGADVASATHAEVVVGRQGAGLALQFRRGEVTDIDGQVTVVSPAAGSGSGVWMAWLLAGIAAPALLGGYTAMDSRRHVRHAAENLAIGNAQAAYRHARAALFFPWKRRQAGTLATIALLRSSRYEAAELELARAKRRGMDAAAHYFLLAYLEAGRGNAMLARAALERSVARNPAYRHEALQHPLLRSLAGPPPGGEVG